MNLPIVIRKLRITDEHPFFEAYREFSLSADFDFVSQYKEGMTFPELLKMLDDQERGVNLPDGFVRSTLLFGFVGAKLVGRAMIRHELNDFLRSLGGHIGYGIVASERGKGYGFLILKKSLAYAKFLGLEEVLVTCDENNIPSKKIIEQAGGKFEGCSDQGETAPKKLLYWISTDQKLCVNQLTSGYL